MVIILLLLICRRQSLKPMLPGGHSVVDVILFDEVHAKRSSGLFFLHFFPKKFQCKGSVPHVCYLIAWAADRACSTPPRVFHSNGPTTMF